MKRILRLNAINDGGDDDDARRYRNKNNAVITIQPSPLMMPPLALYHSPETCLEQVLFLLKLQFRTRILKYVNAGIFIKSNTKNLVPQILKKVCVCLVCVCMCVCVRARVCVCVCVCKREKEREMVYKA